MRYLLLIAVAFLVGAAALAKPLPADKDHRDRRVIAEEGVTTPSSVPLNARLSVQETIYYLDRGGLSAKNYRAKLENALPGQMLAPPRLEATFELQNKGTEEMQVVIGGDVSGSLRWNLGGPGAVRLMHRPIAQTDDFKPATIVKIAPGGSQRWTFRDLDCSGPRDQNRVYWTEPGDYLLSAGFTVAVRPAPKGSVPHWYHKDHGNVAISSGPVRITVLER